MCYIDNDSFARCTDGREREMSEQSKEWRQKMKGDMSAEAAGIYAR